MILSNNSTWNRISFKPSFGYRLNNRIKLDGGVGLYYVFGDLEENRFEISPWQGVSLNWPHWDRLRFIHSFKFEERFSFQTNNDWSSSFGFRMRLKTAGEIKICRQCKGSYWNIPFHAEFFQSMHNDIKELFKDKRRFGLGIGYVIPKNWAITFQFILQGSEFEGSNNYTISDNVFQLKFLKLW